MRPPSEIFSISGVCILSTRVRLWRMLIRHRRTRVSERDVYKRQGKEIFSVFSQIGYEWGDDANYDGERAAQELLKSLN